MKIAITAVGTRGDVQPYVALGCALRAAGHQVLLVSAYPEADFVRAHGLDFAPLSADVQQLQQRGRAAGLGQGTGPLHFVRGHLRQRKQLRAALVRVLHEMWDACQDADLLVYHPGLPLGFFQAQATGRPGVLATPFPLLPTAHYPALLFYQSWWQRLGLNGLTHRLFGQLFWSLGRGALAEFWRQRQPGPRPDWSVPGVRQHQRSGQLILNGYSPHLFAPDAAWGPSAITTGTWTLPAPPDYQPPAALAAFLAAGQAPLYVGFGSMPTDDVPALLALVAEAVARVGQRAVVALGWSPCPAEAARLALPPHLCLIDGAPHAWLFERVRLVVHHGGAGTVAAGLRAGRPTVVVPHHADQPAWGQRVYELGVGSRPIPRAGLTAERLAAALAAALEPAVVARAAALGEQLRQEGGAAAAVAAIEAAYGAK